MDGLIYASSIVMFDSARRKVAVQPLARWLLGVGIAATLAANVVHGLGHGPAGAIVAAWPAVALVGSYELLMVIIRSVQATEGTVPGLGISGAPGDGQLQAQAAEAFADEVAARHVPSVRTIRARLHVGQPRPQRVRAYLTALATRRGNSVLHQADAVQRRASNRRYARYTSRCKAAEPAVVANAGCACERDFEYTEDFHNRRRCHSALDWATPLEFETEHRHLAITPHDPFRETGA